MDICRLMYTFKVYREESNKLPKYEKQLALTAKTQPKLLFAHVRRNQHLKKNIIGLKDNEGETIFIPSAQTELLKNFYSFIFREGDARPTPTLLFPTVVMPVLQFSIPVVQRELSSLDISKGAGPDDIPRRWYAGLMIFWLNPCLNYSPIP